MTKTVVDVGNCEMDHGSLRAMLEPSFQVSLIQAHSADEALDLLRSRHVDLLLVNRKLDRDQSDGLEIIKRVKGDPELAATACMLISNFEESQQQARDAGAEPGFGKLRLQDAETKARLAKVLE
jgi:CheY-like chemotaxis protein